MIGGGGENPTIADPPTANEIDRRSLIIRDGTGCDLAVCRVHNWLAIFVRRRVYFSRDLFKNNYGPLIRYPLLRFRYFLLHKITLMMCVCVLPNFQQVFKVQNVIIGRYAD